MIDRFSRGLYTLAVVLAQLDHVTTHMAPSLWYRLLGVNTYTVEKLATQLTAHNDQVVTGTVIAHLFLSETTPKSRSEADGWLLARGVQRLPHRLRDSVSHFVYEINPARNSTAHGFAQPSLRRRHICECPVRTRACHVSPRLCVFHKARRRYIWLFSALSAAATMLTVLLVPWPS